jgi:hypothetical protein
MRIQYGAKHKKVLESLVNYVPYIFVLGTRDENIDIEFNILLIKFGCDIYFMNKAYSF